MTLFDKHFGGEVITQKGKVFKFDDVSCMVSFLKSGEVKPDQIQHQLVIDYGQPEKLIDVSNSSFVYSPEIKSPMNGNFAAFSKSQSAEERSRQWHGKILTWSEVVEN